MRYKQPLRIRKIQNRFRKNKSWDQYFYKVANHLYHLRDTNFDFCFYHRDHFNLETIWRKVDAETASISHATFEEVLDCVPKHVRIFLLFNLDLFADHEEYQKSIIEQYMRTI